MKALAIAVALLLALVADAAAQHCPGCSRNPVPAPRPCPAASLC